MNMNLVPWLSYIAESSVSWLAGNMATVRFNVKKFRMPVMTLGTTYVEISFNYSRW